MKYKEVYVSNWISKLKEEVNNTPKSKYKETELMILRDICNEVIVADSISIVDINRGYFDNYLPNYHPIFIKYEIMSRGFNWLTVKYDKECFYYDKQDFNNNIDHVYFTSLPFFIKCWWCLCIKTFTSGDRSKFSKIKTRFN